MPFGGALTAGIGGVASLVSGLIGSSSAEKAAAQAAAADKAAATGVTNATVAGQGDITAGQGTADTAIASGVQQAQGTIASAGQQQASLYNNMETPLQPYQAAGTSGLTNLSSMAGTFQAPTAAQAAQTPGYQFELQQGLKALNNNAATSGMLQSGANMKANVGYAEGLASTNYQQAYNNSLGTFNTNQAGYQTLANLGTPANSQNLQAGATYGGQVTSLANLGANTSMQGGSELANTALHGNEAAATLGLQGATTAGNFLTNAGNATAAGTAGAGNALTSAVNGGANALMGASSMINTGTVQNTAGGFDPYSTAAPANYGVTAPLPGQVLMAPPPTPIGP